MEILKKKILSVEIFFIVKIFTKFRKKKKSSIRMVVDIKSGVLLNFHMDRYVKRNLRSLMKLYFNTYIV